MNSYRQSMVYVLQDYLRQHIQSGAWVVSCWSHPIKNHDFYWSRSMVGQVGKKRDPATLSTVFMSWYNAMLSGVEKGRDNFIRIDGEWGSNSCYSPPPEKKQETLGGGA